MTFRHVFVSLAVTCLAACSSDDTIVSLNVAATDRVPVVDRIEVTFKQGSRSFVYDFKPPLDPAKGETPASLKNNFFERITLPGDWSEADANISVEAFAAGDEPFSPPLTGETTTGIDPEHTVTAFVKLDIPESPPAGGAGGEGGGGGGGAPSEGGGPADGGAPPAGGGPGDAGGEANAGGTAGDSTVGGAGGAGGVGGAG